MKTLDDAPFLDIFDESFQADVTTVMDRLRAESWLVRTPIGGLVIGREQVQNLMADRRLRSSVVDFLQIQGVTDGILHDRMQVSLLATEGNDHTRLRKLVSRAFTPRAVDPHRPLMRDTLDALLEPVAAAGRCDFMTAIGDHYPIQVMCHLLGVPVDDHAEFATWNNAITWALSFELAAHREEAEWGMKHMDDYVAGLVARRRHDPHDDLVTALVQAEEEGDRLSDAELLSMIGGLLFAGYDTTRNQLGLAMWLFAEHADQWEHLGGHPELAPRRSRRSCAFAGPWTSRRGSSPRTSSSTAIDSPREPCSRSPPRRPTMIRSRTTTRTTSTSPPNAVPTHLRRWTALLPRCQLGARRDAGSTSDPGGADAQPRARR